MELGLTGRVAIVSGASKRWNANGQRDVPTLAMRRSKTLTPEAALPRPSAVFAGELAGIIRRLLRDGNVVGMALSNRGSRDLNESRILSQLLDR